MKKKIIFVLILIIEAILLLIFPCRSKCNCSANTERIAHEIMGTKVEPAIENESISSTYTEDELDLLSRLVNAEAGSDWLTDEHQRAVASVVLNRVSDNRFPNTIHSVIYQRGQYACTWNGMINKMPSQRAVDNARYVLENGVTVPENVIFQAQFKQGKGVWKYIQGHYFCY